jgi:L-asparaginase II
VVSPVVVAEVVRSGFVEGHHHGSVVALAEDGEPAWSVGDVTSPVLPRSCNKPLQALGMVRLGLDLPPELMALACASHSGEPFHLEGVRRILALADLDVDALQTPPDYPLDDTAKVAAIRAGEEPSSLAMNCSGKHAAMLLTCAVNGWDTATYRSPDHPLQQGIATAFAELTGEPVAVTAVDGCGAPLLSTSLTGLARAFRALALATDGPEHRVAEAIRAYPEYVSGTTRDELKLLTAIPGAIGKAGAEACYAVALPDGRAYALKVDDGGARARPVVMAAALRRDGVPTGSGVDAAALDDTGRVPVLGAGEPVGEIRAAFC